MKLARSAVAFAGVFGVGFALLWGLYSRSPLLYDTDAEFHLSVARTYAEGTLREGLEDLRYSLLGQGGDKELLFHLLLVPFSGPPAEQVASAADPLAGGRLALALLGAAVLALVAALAVRAAGPWGALTPFFLLVAAPEWTWRLIRLRPELLALIWILVAILILVSWGPSRRREAAIAGIAFFFTLSYTAFHAFVGLCGLWFLVSGLRLGFQRWRDWPWRLLIWPALAAGLALVVHPQFPHNLNLWVVQNVSFFLDKGSLAVGTEIHPNTTEVLLLALAPWWLALVVVWRARNPVAEDLPDTGADVLGVAAVVFGLLYLLMSRFVLYAVPLTSLWVLFEIRRRGQRVGRWTRLPVAGLRWPLALALALCTLLALPSAVREASKLKARLGSGEARLDDRRAFGQAVPDGARVAASWADTAIYRFWAPQGHYLNALDPVFFARPHPREHRAWQEIRGGLEPDVPRALASILESDYLAFSLATADPALLARLEGDPRVEEVHRGIHALYRIRPDGAAAFIVDWRSVPESSPLPPPQISPAWPRLRQGPPSALAAFIDLEGRASSCRAAVHPLLLAESEVLSLELAATGPVSLWLDQELLVTSGSDQGAIVGRGLLTQTSVAPGAHHLTVLACPPRGKAQTGAGFFLRRL